MLAGTIRYISLQLDEAQPTPAKSVNGLDINLTQDIRIMMEFVDRVLLLCQRCL
jgi:hypothetical protein